jgi:peptide chain release factor 1
VVEVVALAGALADAGEHGIAAVRLGDVVDQLHDDDGLADAGAAEQADFAALGIWGEQIHHLDAGDENLRFGRLFGEGRRRLMDRPLLIVRDRTGLVDRIADHVDDTAQRAIADRNRDRLPGVGHLLPPHEPFRRIHGDGAHGRLAEMLGDFEHQAMVLILRFECVEDRRQIRLEMHVDDGADDLGDVPDWIGHGWSLLLHRD